MKQYSINKITNLLQIRISNLIKKKRIKHKKHLFILLNINIFYLY